MPQQINLCMPILLTQKRYFSAATMVQTLAFFLVVGGGLCAYWVWSLTVASEGFKKTLATQGLELESLQAAVAQGQIGVGLTESALTQELRARRTELAQREQLLAEMQRGLFRPGWGHSARLRLVAQTIPAQAWVTQLRADDVQLDVSGFTLEPAALNDWVARLAASPLLQGQRLSTVKVENVTAAVENVASRPMWSFNLLSAVGKPAGAAGSKP